MSGGNADQRLAIATRVLSSGACLLAGTFCLGLLVLFALRITHPYDIEWMEGVVVDHILRVLAGEPLYVAPTLDFTPLIYPPFFYYVAAAATAVFGEGLLAPRLVSAASTIGCLVVLFVFARRETGQTRSGLIAAGLYAASFEQGGGWFDLARVDNLFMLLLLCGSYVVRFATATRAFLLAGALFFLAAITKQTGIVIPCALALYVLFARGWRPAIVFGVAFGAPFVASVVCFDLVSNGWHTYFVYTLPSEHKIILGYLQMFLQYDLLRPMPYAVLLLVAYLVAAGARLIRMSGEDRSSAVFLLLFCTAMLFAAAVSRIHVGGAANVLLPAYAAIALGVGVAVQSGWLGRYVPPRVRGNVAPLVWALIVVQFVVLAFDPRTRVPSDAAVRAGDRFVAEIALIEGEVFTPDHGYLAARVGKKSYAHYVPLWDVLRGTPSLVQRDLLRDMRQRVRRREFGAIMIHEPTRLTRDLKTPTRRDYVEAGMVLPEGWRFAPLGVSEGNAVRLVPRMGRGR